MSKHFKVLSLGVLAVALLAVVAAPAAQAGEFRAAEYPATVSGEQITFSLTTAVGTLKCKVVKFSGVLKEEGSETLETSPTTEGCTTGTTTTDVNWNGCTYVLNAGQTINGNPDEVEGSMDMKCPPNQKLEETVTSSPDCTITFPPQNGMSKVIFTNETLASPMDVKADTEGKSVHYTLEGSGCGKTGTFNDGTISGAVTQTAPGGYTVT